MIAVVGGGWYGCHIAMALKERGIAFELFEAEERLFECASGYNQNRLHLGFHYPRSSETRSQSQQGCREFLARYPTLATPIIDNLYAICRDESLVDFSTYCQVMEACGLWFEIVSTEPFGLTNVTGCIRCGEHVIKTNEAREFFRVKLFKELNLGCRFDAATPGYDRIINCTYQGFEPLANASLTYEACVMLLYRSRQREAITIMDGPFYSLYPDHDDWHTLYSVEHSRVAQCDTYAQADKKLAAYCDTKAHELRRRMEPGITKYLPSFRDRYIYSGWQGAVRACSKDASDSRACRIVESGNMIHAIPGKIDGIFHAEREVLKCLGCS